MEPLTSDAGPLTIHAPTAASTRSYPTGPGPGVVVATFDGPQEAEQAVDILVSRGFPVAGLSLQGTDVRIIEHIIGALTYRGVAVRGGLIGAVGGAVLGACFGLIGLVDPAVSAVAVVVWSTGLGAAIGVGLAGLRRWIQEGRRDFLARAHVAASRYELVCDRDRAEEAARLLEPVLTYATPRMPDGA